MQQLLRVSLLLGGLVFPNLGWGFTVSVPILEQIQLAALKQQFMEYLEMAKQTEHQIRQLQNQVMQIKHAYTTVEHGVKNLAQLDINGAQDILNLHNTLIGKMRRIDSIGYTSEQAWKRAQKLYAKGRGTLSAAEQQALELLWADAQREAAQVGIETQAILESQAQHATQWQDILQAAHAAEGNLQAQQAAVQAQGILGSQLQELTQVVATTARHASMQALEAARRTEMEQTALQHITAEIDTTYQSAGRRLNMTRTGRE